MRKKTKEKAETYVPGRLEELTLGIQRIAVILPVEEQESVGKVHNDDMDVGKEQVDGEAATGLLDLVVGANQCSAVVHDGDVTCGDQARIEAVHSREDAVGSQVVFGHDDDCDNALGKEVRDGKAVLGNETVPGDVGVDGAGVRATGDDGAARVGADVSDVGGNLQ